jgi:hypothetical protein
VTEQQLVVGRRLEGTPALDGHTIWVELDSGGVLTLGFTDGRASWQLPDGRRGSDGYDSVDVAPDTYFIDVWASSWPGIQTSSSSMTLPRGRCTANRAFI